MVHSIRPHARFSEVAVEYHSWITIVLTPLDRSALSKRRGSVARGNVDDDGIPVGSRYVEVAVYGTDVQFQVSARPRPGPSEHSPQSLGRAHNRNSRFRDLARGPLLTVAVPSSALTSDGCAAALEPATAAVPAVGSTVVLVPSSFSRE